MRTDLMMTFMVGLMVNAVLFGAGAITVLSIPGIEAWWKYLLPAVVVLSFALTPFIASRIAPKMRLRNRRPHVVGA